ncbi:hypothetical protein F2Q69_00009499 [Brassica cretica]|uniref:Urease accessory protein UreH-like transmembrane domain-containing protein n=1 Tax=Brassica cretica TaxID=69181 RepID=A0A8S9P2B2_BRACR|nr:hypothetical protein F2Q69_00009499 [Brassica cretica]
MTDVKEEAATNSKEVSVTIKTLSTGMVILISAVDVLLLNPLLASPAKSGWLTSAWTGFLACCLHTLSGPDHLAALAPLSIGRTKMESSSVGALWGCGHDGGQVIFGLLSNGNQRSFRSSSTLCRLRNRHDSNGERGLDASPKKKKIGFATFATGVVHGLQPDALMTVLPALALPSRLAGSAFLIMFLVGTVVAMGSYTAFIGSCSEALKEKMPRITEKLTWVSSIMAIGLGLGIVISPFFGFNLY